LEDRLMETPQRYPLFWPAGWPRARSRHTAAFGKMRTTAGQSWQSKGRITTAEAMDRLEGELDRLGARNPLLSSNVDVTMSGRPRSGAAEPSDPGVALYFDLGGKPISLACDKWDRVADNITALAKHIEALRGQDRWGVGTLDRAFTGYEALPAPEQWFNVLRVSARASRAEVEAAYRESAKAAHPDRGGSDAAMSRVNAAYEAAKADLEERGL
jgi:hypothetical protein